MGLLCAEEFCFFLSLSNGARGFTCGTGLSRAALKCNVSASCSSSLFSICTASRCIQWDAFKLQPQVCWGRLVSMVGEAGILFLFCFFLLLCCLLLMPGSWLQKQKWLFWVNCILLLPLSNLCCKSRWLHWIGNDWIANSLAVISMPCVV